MLSQVFTQGLSKSRKWDGNMLPTVRFVSAVVWFGLLLGWQATFIASAQDVISCSSNFGNAVELDTQGFRIVSPGPDKITTLALRTPALSAGPFDLSKFAFDRIEVFLVEESRGEAGYGESTVFVYARALRGKKESWFSVVPGDSDW